MSCAGRIPVRAAVRPAGQAPHDGPVDAAGPRAGRDGAGIGHRVRRGRVLGIGIAVVALVAAYYRPLGFRFSSAVNVSTMVVERMRPYTSTIFAEMSALAVRTGAINLGQGFPDTDGPPSLLADAAANITGGVNQYPPGLGVPALRAAVAEHQRRFYGLDVDPDDVLVTTGATEAIASAVLGAVRAGRRGRRLRAVLRLLRRHHRARGRGAAARRRCGRRRSASTPTSCAPPSRPRTRLVLVNTPHNPTGAVFTADAAHHDRRAGRRVRRGASSPTRCTSTCSYDGRPHVPMASLPGMAERTLHDLVGGQDVLRHRLEGRLDARAARAGGGGEGGQAVPDLRRRARRSSPRSPPRWACPTPSTPTSPTNLQRKRDLLCDGAARRRVHGVPDRGHVLRRHRRRAAGHHRRRRVLLAAARADRRRGGAGVGVLRRPRPRRARWSGSRSASATRCSTEAVSRLAGLKAAV